MWSPTPVTLTARPTFVLFQRQLTGHLTRHHGMRVAFSTVLDPGGDRPLCAVFLWGGGFPGMLAIGVQNGSGDRRGCFKPASYAAGQAGAGRSLDRPLPHHGRPANVIPASAAVRRPDSTFRPIRKEPSSSGPPPPLYWRELYLRMPFLSRGRSSTATRNFAAAKTLVRVSLQPGLEEAPRRREDRLLAVPAVSGVQTRVEA